MTYCWSLVNVKKTLIIGYLPLSGDCPFTWRLLLWTWRWLLGYLPMGRLLDIDLILRSRWLMVDVEFILKRRWLLGNNGDFPFTWRSFNTELTLTYAWRWLHIKKTLTICYLPLRLKTMIIGWWRSCRRDVDLSLARLRWICYDKDVDYRLMKKQSGDLSVYLTSFALDMTLSSRLLADGPFTWHHFGTRCTLTLCWIIMDVHLILKRFWLLGNNGDFPILDVILILTSRWLIVKVCLML